MRWLDLKIGSLWPSAKHPLRHGGPPELVLTRASGPAGPRGRVSSLGPVELVCTGARAEWRSRDLDRSAFAALDELAQDLAETK